MRRDKEINSSFTRILQPLDDNSSMRTKELNQLEEMNHAFRAVEASYGKAYSLFQGLEDKVLTIQQEWQ